MGFIQTCSFSIKIQYFSLIFTFFLISTTTHSRLIHKAESNLKLTEKLTQMERGSMLIGSRPPRCEKRYCTNCDHCEAVQVPVVLKFIRTTQLALGTTPKSLYDLRDDDISNYKPMCWKCKCGDLMFNP